MQFYLIGVAVDPVSGEDMLDEKGGRIQSVYATSSDQSVAIAALQQFRAAQTGDRTTYAPGNVGSVKDVAFMAELKAKTNCIVPVAAGSFAVTDGGGLLDDILVGEPV